VEIAVVYESMFGATREIAEAVAAGAAEATPGAAVACARVAAADLLFVGGPTHMRGMSTGMTRRMAVSIEHSTERKGKQMGHGLEPGAEGEGLRNWFHDLPKAPSRRSAAAFDTRGEGPMVGAAAKGIAQRLERHGYRLATEPMGFVVEGDAGLLRAGEADRARAWGAQVARACLGYQSPALKP
jgi:hypothetical protein